MEKTNLYILMFIGLFISACAVGPATEIQLAGFSQTCKNYGFQSGTPAFSNCVQKLDQNRIAKSDIRRVRIANALGTFANNQEQNRVGQQRVYQTQERNRLYRERTNKNITCRSSTYGNTTNTSCY